MITPVTVDNVSDLINLLNRASQTGCFVRILYRHVPDAHGNSDGEDPLLRWVLPIPVRRDADGKLSAAVIEGSKGLFLRCWDLHTAKEREKARKEGRRTKYGKSVAELINPERTFAIRGIEAWDTEPIGPMPRNYVFFKEICEHFPQVREALGFKRAWQHDEATGKKVPVFVAA